MVQNLIFIFLTDINQHFILDVDLKHFNTEQLVQEIISLRKV
jgi:hypothetical protein